MQLGSEVAVGALVGEVLMVGLAGNTTSLKTPASLGEGQGQGQTSLDLPSTPTHRDSTTTTTRVELKQKGKRMGSPRDIFMAPISNPESLVGLNHGTHSREHSLSSDRLDLFELQKENALQEAHQILFLHFSMKL